MEKIELKNLDAFVKSVISGLCGREDRATIIALAGDLGAGKTTFVQVLAKELGVVETVQSPTYVLMKSYPLSHDHFTTLIHIDAYRLNSVQEFSALKPETFLSNPKALVCIEWPERVEGALPKPDIVLKFSSDGASPGERYITTT
ncbi:MAG TPA: tRNA (adenosine(37)-N6)-threonylcarbamoyltransferase complex ATPase subunit type 1 TsaE [Candidatus Paceibacterota bacterium]|nr:tRNA (adenosine(37)-N6)-threonylcarbamoyltransferase complex ATPase subunit type 1 TsaE [Candidatus Paceibacterota bacterium]